MPAESFRRRCPQLIGAVILIAAMPAMAQVNTGTVTGTVSDPTGLVLSGVAVKLTSSRVLGPSPVTVTDRAGRYRFGGLAPGVCELEFALAGFKSVTRSGVGIAASFVSTIDIVLELGAIVEVIQISGRSPVVDVRSNVQQTAIDQPMLEGLPTGRDPWSAASLIPGVVINTYDVGGSAGMQAGLMSVHGSRVSDVTYAIDGLSVNYPGPSGAASGGQSSIYFDQGLFEEINYQVSAVPAEVSAGGMYLNMVTRSGSNIWSGDARAAYAGEETQSNNFERVAKARGVAAGNPITQQYDANLSASGPLRRDRLWVFGSYRQWKVDKRLLAVFNEDGTTAIDDNLIWSASGKLSAQATPAHKFSALAIYSEKNRYHRRDAPPNYIQDAASVLQQGSTLAGQVKYSGVLGASVVEAGVGGLSGNNPSRYQPQVRPTDLRREDSVLSTAAGAARAHVESPFRKIVIDGVVSHSRVTAAGSHLFRAGVQFTTQRFEERNQINGDVRLVYQNGTANQVIIFNTPVSARSASRQLGLFGQDSWLIGRNLTLNVGLRVDRAEGWIPAQASPGGRFVAARDLDRRNVYDQWLGVWRIGAAYDPSGRGRTAFKASVSRYGQQFGMNLVTSVHPFSLSQAALSWRDANNNDLPEPSELGTFEGFTGGATSRYATNGGPDWSYSDELTAGLEQAVPGGIRMSAMYFRRMNRATVGSRNAAVPSSAYRAMTVTNPLGGTLPVFNLDPAFLGRQDTVRDNESLLDSDYSGIEIMASRRWSARWQGLLGFTGGRSETGFDFGDLNDPNNLQFQQGRQLDDLTYQWRASGSYIIPGIELSTGSTFLYNSGPPRQYTLNVTRNELATLTRASQLVRANQRGDVRRPPLMLWNLRMARTFTLSGRVGVEPQLDVFNVTNADTAIAIVDTIGPALNRTSEILAPRLIRLGVVVRF